MQSLNDCNVSTATDPGGTIKFDFGINSAIDFSSLTFVPLGASASLELGKRLENTDTVRYADGSVCACAFEAECIVKIETREGKVFHLTVDASHHHAAVFRDHKYIWGGRLPNSSWVTDIPSRPRA